MPRLPRILAAGLLLFAAVLVLTALASPRSTGPVAVAVFVPLWYFIAVVNMWLGVVSAGYPLRAELPVFGLVFGVPATVAVVVGVAFAPTVTGGRFMFLWLAGLALWAAILLLIGLLTQTRPVFAPAVLVFGPLWLIVCVVNLVLGVQTAGYGVAEELPVLVANAGLPLGIALGVWLARRRRFPVTP